MKKSKCCNYDVESTGKSLDGRNNYVCLKCECNSEIINKEIELLNFCQVIYDKKDLELIREINGPNFNDLVNKINEIINYLHDHKRNDDK